MSDPAVSERRIRPIQDAVAGTNWKQALQLCDKWSKKGEKSDRFLALKAFVLVNQPDKSQHDRGQAEVLELCKRNPPITDPEAIYQMQDALKSLSLNEEEGPKLWERAVIAKQNDKDLYIRWLNQAIADDNWLSAQKATMGLRKSFPKERNYEFWNILMCLLIHMQHDLPEKDRMLFGTLAYRMISKATETIPLGQEQALSSGKAISTPEEISLLAQVLNYTGRAEETVRLLRGESLNMTSRIGKQDPQLVLSLLLESLNMSEQWSEALSVCQELLAKAEFQSDDRIWNLWLKAQSRCSDDEFHSQSPPLLDSLCNVKPIIRGPYLAKMAFLRARKNDGNLDALLRTCKEYSEAFALKAFCFDDLKESLRQLDKARFDDFMKCLSENHENLAELFKLKLSYSSFSSDVRRKDLLDFICRALSLYQGSLSKGPACAEAAILAVMALLRLSQTEDTRQSILFAIIFLQIARSEFEDYYLLNILLVQLQSYLGLLSLAMESFVKLSVKNMQWETVGHLILTRISSLHPSSTGHGENAFEPLKVVDTGLTVLENAENALVRGIREGLRFSSYSNIYNSIRMRSDIERSVNRQVYAIEERKLRRLLGQSDETILPACPSTIVDSRDVSYLPNYAENDSALLASFRRGPLPKEDWINTMAIFDNVATHLKADLTSQVSLAPKTMENIRTAQLRVDASSEGLAAQLTLAELSNLASHQILAEAVMAKERPGQQDKLAVLLEDLKSWLSARLTERKSQPPGSIVAGIRVPDWEDLHTSLTQLETLQVVAMLVASLGKRAKMAKPKAVSISKETLAEIHTLVSDLEQQIHSDARDIKEQINAPGVLTRLVDLGMAREGDVANSELESLLEKLCDEVTMETICGRLKESWEDALDGVLAVKVKWFK
ncbi:uncharacterized protein Z518_10492 [Rhinocladiella mackenziei CBS 650.93]|uniref:Cytoskeleton organization protein n=1 Tax=Rhinocladiella mackenziei CBS 650.93 TaxID=1442369 RepID=A0A0D2GPR5_9EURO|nr:uncharacterized protein Z518_10492 [Rhinocladiella mackenziei CBS 650.93]KIX00353.1 hypothetical protein Z518_10492 [Rhinocladiella mackenziei CBS 650.93]